MTAVSTLGLAADPDEKSQPLLDRSSSLWPSVRKSRRGPGRLVIAKFGGSSLANAKRINHSVQTVAREYSRGTRLVVVVSAIGKTTDQLLELTNNGSDIVENDRDEILSMGERTSARIFTASLKSRGVQARYFDPADKDWPIITDDQFSNANPIRKSSTQRIVRYVKPLIENGIVPVISGFIGKTRDGRISTLGRGGSDTTALLFASALEADEVVIVTSSTGVLTGDPRLIRKTQTIPRIDMKALVGIADAGTKFIHRKALRFKDPNINIRVVSNTTDRLHSHGTLITGDSLPELDVILHNPHPIASVTLVGKDLPHRPELVKKITQAAKTNLVAVSQDSHSAIFYVRQTSRLNMLVNQLHDITVKDPAGLAVATRLGMALIVVKGVGLEDTPGVIARISDTLRSNQINIFGILTITSSVHVLVDWKTRKRATRLIRNSLENQS